MIYLSWLLYKNQYYLSQYLMCFIVSSVNLAFLIVPVINSLICYLRLRMAMACWSWSE